MKKLIIIIIILLLLGAVYYVLTVKPCAYLQTGYKNTETGKCENFSTCGNIPSKYINDSSCKN